MYTGKQNVSSIDIQQSKGEPEKKRTSVKSSKQWKDWGFFACGEKVTEENGDTRYIGVDSYCENPLRAISDLTDLFKKVNHIFAKANSKQTNDQIGQLS